MKNSLTIKYTNSADTITSTHLEGFFVDWKNKPSSETLLKLLKQSSHFIVAMDESKVIGFITAMSDGTLSAYIPFLEVLPEYQNQGIGSELMKRMLEKLDGIYMIDLSCDEEMQSFYEQFGMKKSVGMSVRNYENQGGK